MKNSKEPSVIHSTFVIERSYSKPPERVFSAFASAPQKRRWFFEGRLTEIEMYELDFREGGSEHAHLRFKEGSPFPGVVWSRKQVIWTLHPIGGSSPLPP